MKAFLDRLAELEAPLNPPAKEEEIQNAEQRIGLQFPEPLRELYRCFNGTSGEFSETLWLFYPLALTGTIRQIYPHLEFPTLLDYGASYPDQYVLFADAQIGAPFYAICADLRSPSYGKVVFTDLGPDVTIFPSASFMERFQELFLTQHNECEIEEGSRQPPEIH